MSLLCFYRVCVDPDWRRDFPVPSIPRGQGLPSWGPTGLLENRTWISWPVPDPDRHERLLALGLGDVKR